MSRSVHRFVKPLMSTKSMAASNSHALGRCNSSGDFCASSQCARAGENGAIDSILRSSAVRSPPRVERPRDKALSRVARPLYVIESAESASPSTGGGSGESEASEAFSSGCANASAAATTGEGSTNATVGGDGSGCGDFFGSLAGGGNRACTARKSRSRNGRASRTTVSSPTDSATKMRGGPLRIWGIRLASDQRRGPSPPTVPRPLNFWRDESFPHQFRNHRDGDHHPRCLLVAWSVVGLDAPPRKARLQKSFTHGDLMKTHRARRRCKGG